MDPRSAATGTPDPDAIEFVRFCYRRRHVGWPELYDEMCAVAGRGLFRGYSADDLAGLGIGFSLFGMPALSVLASRVVAEEQALRRPVTVTITAEVAEASEPRSAPTDAPVAQHVALDQAPTDHEERSFDVPIRLSLAPSGA
ncbi:MAG: hypothetical protein A2Z32_08680 [Chloroflexi bacterium RBG_16_69_14]|nr:MAG: hypothetical protein A2Z32_08680 [Chloroflexi bacterium RBG_16_69_14]